MRPKKVSRVPRNAKQPLGLLPGAVQRKGAFKGCGRARQAGFHLAKGAPLSHKGLCPHKLGLSSSPPLPRSP